MKFMGKRGQERTVWAARSGCWQGRPKMNAVPNLDVERRSQRWMPWKGPEVDALREQGLNNTTKRRRFPRNGLVRTAVLPGRDAFRVKVAET